MINISSIIEFEEIESTNLYLKNNYKSLNNYTVVKTKYQTNGYGQFERKWESASNQNLLFSLLLKERTSYPIEKINIMIVESIIDLLKEYKINAKFKFPNDIMVDSKKIAGILIETKYINSNLDYIIIGIGLNINQVNFYNENAISIKTILGESLDIDYIFNQLIVRFNNKI